MGIGLSKKFRQKFKNAFYLKIKKGFLCLHTSIHVDICGERGGGQREDMQIRKRSEQASTAGRASFAGAHFIASFPNCILYSTKSFAQTFL